MKPTYFDMTVQDLSSARQFFKQVFAWRFERFAMPYEYYRITAGPADEPGIDGGIGQLSDLGAAFDRPMVTLTIPVSDLDAMIKSVTGNGGTVIEPRMPIPGVGWYATCAEPGGLRFGMIQADNKAE
jgi:predicted enzyme related to lactoylglutathione lyase